MSDELFRIVIAVGVSVAAIGFLVQAIVAIVFYGTIKKLHQRVFEVASAAEPVVAKIGPTLDKAGPLIDRLGPMLDKATETLEQAKPAINESVVVIRKAGTMIERAGPIVDSTQQMLVGANQIIADSRPKIAEFSDEALGGIRSAREQVDRIGDLLHETSGRARARLQQLDETVEHTVEQVGHVGDSLKNVVMRPVREANGLAAGISAAMSTLVHARKSPENATQDEEMFI